MRKRVPLGIWLLIMAVVVAAAIGIGMRMKHVFLSHEEENLARKKGVKATCDSAETEELSAEKAIDGDDETLSSRWSSENNWEDASHYIELEFPEEISVSFVILKWERTNVTSYRLEGSLDGDEWVVLADFKQAPETKRQEIPLTEPATVRFLRLSTYAVSQREEDYSNLYQNVSLYEFEVYADKPAAYSLEAPEIAVNGNNERYLKVPEAPEGYRVSYLGADYEQIIGADGTVYDTVQEKEVTVGFLVERIDAQEEAKEVAFKITVSPSSDRLQGSNMAPQVIPAIAEWDGGEGVFTPGRESRVIVEEDPLRDSLKESASLFVKQYQMIMGYEIPIVTGGMENVRAGDFYLGYAADIADGADEAASIGEPGTAGSADDVSGTDADAGSVMFDERETLIRLSQGIGEEGYVCDISDKCVIIGTDKKGIYWGAITILQMLSQQTDHAMQDAIVEGESAAGQEAGAEEGSAARQEAGAEEESDTVQEAASYGIPQGRIRDYPKYPVRGFGIDVARKPVSIDMLYQIMTNMSWYKMNDLAIHLNDNVILSTSGLTGSVEEAMTAASAFRLGIGMTNAKGERLASDEYAYTPEELAQLIETAELYGVEVVPEIDTPAHSLAITKLFPEYALTVRNEAVDQIDLSKEEAVDIVKEIWNEAIGSGAFAGASTLNVGMDEYYGDGETYRKYMKEMIAFVKEKSGVENVRVWGSLSNMGGSSMPETEGLQMNIWSTVWADPLAMYEAGYSLINMQNNHLYIIPGGGYDYLDTKELFDHWEPNKFYDYNQLERVPSYSPQMLGAAYMIWNDMCGSLDVGISESDLFARFYEPLGVISGKLWGETTASYEEWMARFHELGNMPESNPYALPRWEGEIYLTAENEVISLSGGSDYVETGYKNCDNYDNYVGKNYSKNNIINKQLNDNTVVIGGSYEVSMQLYRESVSLDETAAADGAVQEEILFETDSAYGQTAFKAAQIGTGKVGFSREGRDYSFDYTLPVGEWATLTVCGEADRTSLYVNGKLMDVLGDSEPFTEYASFAFPLERIGSKTNSFHGKIREVTVMGGFVE